MAHTIQLSRPGPYCEPAYNLKVGDLAQVSLGTSYAGHFLLRHQGGFVSLTSPNLTWTLDCSLPVRKLLRGESITLTVTEEKR